MSLRLSMDENDPAQFTRSGYMNTYKSSTPSPNKNTYNPHSRGERQRIIDLELPQRIIKKKMYHKGKEFELLPTSFIVSPLSAEYSDYQYKRRYETKPRHKSHKIPKGKRNTDYSANKEEKEKEIDDDSMNYSHIKKMTFGQEEEEEGIEVKHDQKEEKNENNRQLNKLKDKQGQEEDQEEKQEEVEEIREKYYKHSQYKKQSQYNKVDKQDQEDNNEEEQAQQEDEERDENTTGGFAHHEGKNKTITNQTINKTNEIIKKIIIIKDNGNESSEISDRNRNKNGNEKTDSITKINLQVVKSKVNPQSNTYESQSMISETTKHTITDNQTLTNQQTISDQQTITDTNTLPDLKLIKQDVKPLKSFVLESNTKPQNYEKLVPFETYNDDNEQYKIELMQNEPKDHIETQRAIMKPTIQKQKNQPIEEQSFITHQSNQSQTSENREKKKKPEIVKKTISLRKNDNILPETKANIVISDNNDNNNLKFGNIKNSSTINQHDSNEAQVNNSEENYGTMKNFICNISQEFNNGIDMKKNNQNATEMPYMKKTLSDEKKTTPKNKKVEEVNEFNNKCNQDSLRKQSRNPYLTKEADKETKMETIKDVQPATEVSDKEPEIKSRNILVHQYDNSNYTHTKSTGKNTNDKLYYNPNEYYNNSVNSKNDNNNNDYYYSQTQPKDNYETIIHNQDMLSYVKTDPTPNYNFAYRDQNDAYSNIITQTNLNAEKIQPNDKIIYQKQKYKHSIKAYRDNNQSNKPQQDLIYINHEDEDNNTNTNNNNKNNNNNNYRMNEPSPGNLISNKRLLTQQNNYMDYQPDNQHLLNKYSSTMIPSNRNHHQLNKQENEESLLSYKNDFKGMNTDSNNYPIYYSNNYNQRIPYDPEVTKITQSPEQNRMTTTEQNELSAFFSYPKVTPIISKRDGETGRTNTNQNPFESSQDHNDDLTNRYKKNKYDNNPISTDINYNLTTNSNHYNQTEPNRNEVAEYDYQTFDPNRNNNAYYINKTKQEESRNNVIHRNQDQSTNHVTNYNNLQENYYGTYQYEAFPQKQDDNNLRQEYYNTNPNIYYQPSENNEYHYRYDDYEDQRRRQIENDIEQARQREREMNRVNEIKKYEDDRCKNKEDNNNQDKNYVFYYGYGNQKAKDIGYKNYREIIDQQKDKKSAIFQTRFNEDNINKNLVYISPTDFHYKTKVCLTENASLTNIKTIKQKDNKNKEKAHNTINKTIDLSSTFKDPRRTQKGKFNYNKYLTNKEDNKKICFNTFNTKPIGLNKSFKCDCIDKDKQYAKLFVNLDDYKRKKLELI